MVSLSSHAKLLSAGLLLLHSVLCCVPISLALLLSSSTWHLARTVTCLCSISFELPPGFGAGTPALVLCCQGARATEMHIALSCIAMGILQSLSIHFIGKVSSDQLRYQRTPSRERVSESALMHYLRKHFFRLMAQKPGLCITRIIQE